MSRCWGPGIEQQLGPAIAGHLWSNLVPELIGAGFLVFATVSNSRRRLPDSICTTWARVGSNDVDIVDAGFRGVDIGNALKLLENGAHTASVEL